MTGVKEWLARETTRSGGEMRERSMGQWQAAGIRAKNRGFDYARDQRDHLLATFPFDRIVSKNGPSRQLILRSISP